MAQGARFRRTGHLLQNACSEQLMRCVSNFSADASNPDSMACSWSVVTANKLAFAREAGSCATAPLLKAKVLRMYTHRQGYRAAETHAAKRSKILFQHSVVLFRTKDMKSGR